MFYYCCGREKGIFFFACCLFLSLLAYLWRTDLPRNDGTQDLDAGIRFAESGKDVIFKNNGGIIRDTQTGVTTTLRRNNGIYDIGVGVKTGPDCAANAGNPKAGFARRT